MSAVVSESVLSGSAWGRAWARRSPASVAPCGGAVQEAWGRSAPAGPAGQSRPVPGTAPRGPMLNRRAPWSGGSLPGREGQRCSLRYAWWGLRPVTRPPPACRGSRAPGTCQAQAGGHVELAYRQRAARVPHASPALKGAASPAYRTYPRRHARAQASPKSMLQVRNAHHTQRNARHLPAATPEQGLRGA